MLEGFLSHDSKQNDGSYTVKTTMPIARQDACLATVVHCLEEREKREICCQK